MSIRLEDQKQRCVQDIAICAAMLADPTLDSNPAADRIEWLAGRVEALRIVQAKLDKRLVKA